MSQSEAAAPFRLEEDALRCPYPHYNALRDIGGAVWVDELGAFVISDYELVTSLLRQPDLASSRQPTGPGLAAKTRDAIERGQGAGTLPVDAQRHLADPHPKTVFTIDPPQHTQMRKLISRILTPRRARAYEPLVREAAARLADELAKLGEADAVALFARPLPENVILPLLRMPPDMLGDLRHWTSSLTHVIGNPAATDEEVYAMLSGRAQMTEFFGRLLDEVRADPGDDLVTALIEAQDRDGNTLSEGERIGLLINLLVAGNETSIKATSAAVRVLAERPDVWEALHNDRSLVPTFVEEVLRLEPPTQGMFRYLTRETELGDQVLPAGSHVYLNFAAANRDPAVFPDPEDLALGREDASRHVSFGQGPHTCLGAWLARLEITCGVEALLEKLTSITLAPGNDFSFGPSYLLHGLTRLDVMVEAAR
ncbi:MAG: cytochrome P450 [Acidimicrobiales bacterium]